VTSLEEGRFARLEAIAWWDRDRVAEARVLVVGAGALGNEVLKNLGLMGVGRLVVLDRDRVELSNLSRSVLFRQSDAGRPKAECAARALRELSPEVKVQALVGDVTADVGLGFFRWADAVVGALDNREARVFVNAACARVGRPWVDGGIEVLQGVARGFAPPATACYECTMSQVDWDLVNQRRSCAMLARRAVAARGTPTTPTTASVIGGIQAQEVMKLIHGLDALLGRGFVYEGAGHGSYTVSYPVKKDCPWHDPPAPIDGSPGIASSTPLRAIWRRAAERLGGEPDALDLGREIVESFACPACDSRADAFVPPERVRGDHVRCPSCGGDRTPRFLHSLDNDGGLDRTPTQIGLPAWDIVWARRGGDSVGIELAGDREDALGSAA
jgi:molybdopterin/thiamine biosynthesis adenylyltransferase